MVYLPLFVSTVQIPLHLILAISAISVYSLEYALIASRGLCGQNNLQYPHQVPTQQVD
ncbi:hypothetical protein P2J26_04830 [Mannheimia haemolytica]|nr:hypothetical protein [Mannheimia haemolytica]MDW0797090.1 hypothetical protein [Mannheimia haemolytica]MDW0799850.1 hypothetical protein [Mannheimia haemolytica]MDW0805092.1 hypothetical protein [Mannheimia haemolytica]MDW0807826.1 hypothetical protein [Mannheimia haemolytica]